MSGRHLKYAIATYLNAAPLGAGLYRRDDIDVINDLPSRQYRMLKNGQIDAGLMPIVDHLFDPELDILEGMGVCADGKVRSVLLRCKCPVKDVKVVMSDPASHTSNLLAQLIMMARYGVHVDLIAADADAEIVIGDRALAISGSSPLDLDLAGEWKELTGLPFVFAAWTYRKDNKNADKLAQAARESLDIGLGMKDQIAAEYAKKLFLPLSLCRDYLESCVYFIVGDREREGIAEFARLLKHYGLSPGEKGDAS